MEITYVYTKKRAEFGRHCQFSDKNAELIVDIKPNAANKEMFVQLEVCNQEVNCIPEISEHEVNTESFRTHNAGINHVEGGWPRDMNPEDVDQIQRFRKKVEKDELYAASIRSLAGMVERQIMRNNAIDIYEGYFADAEAPETPPSAMITNYFRDPHGRRRVVSSLSWNPTDGRRVAAAYSFPTAPLANYDSYIWNLSFPTSPEFALHTISPILAVAYSPKDSHVILGGCHNGQIGFWDTRKGSTAVDYTRVEVSHKDPVYGAIWINSKSGTEFFTTSTDGCVHWWDTRKMTDPVDTIYLDVTKKQDPAKAVGATCLEYEPTIPTKFMAGSETGSVILCNRKGKTSAEKVVAVFHGHRGPIYSLKRNPFYPKQFLTVGDWTARIWSEDIKDGSIMWTHNHMNFLTDAAWSPTRPGVFFTARADGVLDVWDLCFNQSAATLSVRLDDAPLHSLQVNETGRCAVAGSASGNIAFLEFSEGVYGLQKSEKNAVSSIFERETKRMKIHESRQRELKFRAKSPHSTNPDEENALVEETDEIDVRAEFFKIIESERKARGEVESRKPGPIRLSLGGRTHSEAEH